MLLLVWTWKMKTKNTKDREKVIGAHIGSHFALQ